MSDDIACGVSDTSSLIVVSWAVWYRDGRPRIADSATGFSGNVAQYQQSEPNAGSLDTTEKSLQRAQCDTCGGGGGARAMGMRWAAATPRAATEGAGAIGSGRSGAVRAWGSAAARLVAERRHRRLEGGVEPL